MPDDLEIVVEAYKDELTERLRQWRDALVRHDRVREHLGDVDPPAVRVLGPALLGREHDESSPFVATVLDPRENRSVEMMGRLDGLPSHVGRRGLPRWIRHMLSAELHASAVGSPRRFIDRSGELRHNFRQNHLAYRATLELSG